MTRLLTIAEAAEALDRLRPPHPTGDAMSRLLTIAPASTLP